MKHLSQRQPHIPQKRAKEGAGLRKELDSFHDGGHRKAIAQAKPKPAKGKVIESVRLSIDEDDDHLLECIDGRYLGKTIDGRYEMKELLGSGAMGEVYRALDLYTLQEVAVKIAFGSKREKNRSTDLLLHELEVLGMVQHERIVGCLGSGEVDGKGYIVIEFVDGEDLLNFIERHQQLDLHTALQITVQIAEALEAAAHKGIVHQDVKPENVLVSTKEGAVSVKLSDFGLALVRGENGMRGALGGTPAYMSPEQAEKGDVGPKSDVFSLATTMFEMLSGDPLFVGADPEYVMRGVREYEPGLHALLVDYLPESVNGLITRMHSMNPARRPSIEEVKLRVQAIIESISGQDPGYA
ncbi:MAG: serine/threonine-protein kinase [Candidatus Micrarchaeota archaeon]